jgi:hypothetical protein
MDHGRTHTNPDGGYESFDLVGAKRGSRIGINLADPATDGDEARYYLLKRNDKTGMAARDGWELMHLKRQRGRDRKVGEGAITLFGRMKGGGHIRTPGVVLRLGLELGMPDSETSHVVRSMGAIASMSHMRSQLMIRDRLRELLGRITMKEEL